MIRRVQGHSQRVNTCQLNDPGTVLYTGSYDKTLCVWDLKSNMREPIQIMSDFRDSVTSVTATRNEVIATSVDGSVRIYDLRMGQLHIDNLGLPITHIKLSQDEKCIAASCLGGDLHLVDVGSGVVLQKYQGRIHEAFKLESGFCHDATHLCAASEDGSVRFWHQVTGGPIPMSLSPSMAHPPVKFNKLGSAANIFPTNISSVGNVGEGVKIHNRAIYSIACHPSMNIFVAGSSDGTVSCCSYNFVRGSS